MMEMVLEIDHIVGHLMDGEGEYGMMGMPSGGHIGRKATFWESELISTIEQ